MSVVHWFKIVSRIVSLVAIGALLGWYFGSALWGVTLTLFGLVLYGSHQACRVQAWLQSDAPPPADVYGPWADVVAHIYRQQREAGADRLRLQSMIDYLLASFASMRDGVVIIEQQEGIRWCNEAAAQLLSLRYPDDIGQPITNLVRYPEFAGYLDAGDYSAPLELALEGASERELQITITHISEGDRLLFVHDVTERSRLEKMRRDFVGNVSHELRTPLTVIKGYLENFLASSEQLPAPQVKPLLQMAEQAERMETLLRDLLWLARIESEELEKKNEVVDFAALLEELRQEMAASYPDRQLDINVSCGQPVVGDYRELYSAAANLVQNAFKYSDDHSVVTVTLREVLGRPELSVSDQGIGIDAVHVPRLTERFYRVDDSRSSMTGGTGLGLAIVKHIANGHGARLHIDSKLGKGSTFTLTFPTPPAGAELQRTG